MEKTARDELWRLMTGFQVSQAIHVCAVLGVADCLAERPLTAGQIAQSTGADTLNLNRILRLLCAVGVLNENQDNRFSLTERGAYLRRDVVGSHAAMARMLASESCWSAWGKLAHSVRDGEPAFWHAHNIDVWEYRALHPDISVGFDEAMAASSARFAEDIIAAYDFSRYRKIIDIGGGNGSFLARVLAAAPAASGIVFDQLHVVREAGERIASAGLADRCSVAGGDFFSRVPNGGDAYLLKWILHDWDDDRCVQLLKVCRKSMKPEARLLILEHVIGTPVAELEGKLLDLTMMVMTGGRERTAAEFSSLLERSGFGVCGITPSNSLVSVIEAAPCV